MDRSRPLFFSLGNSVTSVPYGVTARICGRMPAAIVGSYPAGSMDVCLLNVVLLGRSLCDEPINHQRSFSDCGAQLYVI
jgi:hypothetical protein